MTSRARKTETTEPSTVDSPQETQQLAMRDQIDALQYRSEQYDDEALRELTTFEAAFALAEQIHGPVDDVAHVLGDGFALLKDDGKKRLAGVPVLFMEWNFYAGEYGSNFVAVRAVTRNEDGGMSKYIFNDGSAGIANMLAEYTKKTGRSGALFARHGLTASEYTYCEECGNAMSVQEEALDSIHRSEGKHKKATTYYIDTSL